MPLHSTNEWQAPPTGNTGPDGAGTSTVPTQQEDAVTPFKGLALFQCLHFFLCVCVCIAIVLMVSGFGSITNISMFILIFVHSYCTYSF